MAPSLLGVADDLTHPVSAESPPEPPARSHEAPGGEHQAPVSPRDALRLARAHWVMRSYRS